MKLLVTGFAWPPETFLLRLFGGLSDAGVELTIATQQRPEANWLERPGVRWLDLGRRHPLKLLHAATGGCLAPAPLREDLERLRVGLPRGGRQRLGAWHVRLPFAGQRFDAIYFPWNIGSIHHEALFSLGMPIVVSCRGSQVNNAPHDPRRRAFREGLERTLALSTAVHCVSEAMSREAQRYGLDPARARVIRPAVAPDVFRPADHPRPPDGCFRVLTTGSLSWRKGYEAALLTTRHLVDAGVPVHFGIIGDGPDRQRLRYTIDDLGIAEHVTLHGSLAPAQVVERLRSADAFLLSSLTEGISNAVLEAMACALPVVTTDCGGMREAVTDGRQGFCVPVGQPKAAAQALERLHADSALRARMGAAGRKRVQEEFVLQDQIEKFIGLFEEVASGPFAALAREGSASPRA